MTDRGPLYDQNETPEDVATLYSWANLHGAKYRDFSASRAQTREKARLRVQQAIEEEQARSNQQSGQQAPAESATGSEHIGDAAMAEEEARQAQLIAQHTAQQAARQAALLAAEQAAQQAQSALRAAAQQAAAQQAEAARHAAQQAVARQAEAARLDAQQTAQQAAWHQPLTDRFPAHPLSHPELPALPNYPSQFDFPGFAPPPTQRPVASQPQKASMKEDSNPQSRNPWAPVDPRENAGRPAWLTTDRPEPAAQPEAPQAPEDTLQGSRDRMTSRWFALRGLFEGGSSEPVEAPPVPAPSRAPVVA